MYCCSLVSSSQFTWKKLYPYLYLPTLKLLERNHQIPLHPLSTLPSLHLLPPAKKDPCSSFPLPSSPVPARSSSLWATTHTQPRRQRWWFYLKWDSARITPARFGLSVICYLIGIKLFDQSEQESPVGSAGWVKNWEEWTDSQRCQPVTAEWGPDSIGLARKLARDFPHHVVENPEQSFLAIPV